MPIPEYIRIIRQKIGHDLLFMPGVVAVINNTAGHTLLQRRADNGLWSLVGGILEPGEEPADCILREIWEETGLTARADRIIGVYCEPDGIVHYPSGDVVHFITVAFACTPLGGEPAVADEESLEVRYFPPDALPDMDPRHKRYLLQGLRGETTTHFNVSFTPGN